MAQISQKFLTRLKSHKLSMALFYFLFLLLTPRIQAQGSKGIVLEGLLGSPSVKIENSDHTTAIYGGISLLGRIHIPLYENNWTSFNVNLNMKYLDLNNNANNPTQRETGNHIGPGVGFMLTVSRFFLGFDYHFMKARHFWVGNINDYKEYDYSSLSYNYGIHFQLTHTIGVSLSQSQGSAKINGRQVNLNTTPPLKESVYWLHVNFSTGKGVLDLLK